MDKYIAIKVRGLSHWLWFDLNKVTRVDGKFIGKAGWGLDGVFTEIDIPETEIVGEITSSNLQYRK